MKGIIALACLLWAPAARVVAATALNNADPVGFFTAVADRLLKAQFGFGVTNIPVYTNNAFVYPSSVQRLLQLAANIYDASTNRAYPGAAGEPFLPTIFRPRFGTVGNDVFITNWVEVTDTSFLPPALPLCDLTDTNTFSLPLAPDSLVFGVPLVIGARKGLPNFNEIAMQSVTLLSRRLQITRPSLEAPLNQYQTNQALFVGISNVLAVELWNSYGSNYTRPMQIYAYDYLGMGLTNEFGFSTNLHSISFGMLVDASTDITVWPGYSGQMLASDPSFVIPLYSNVLFQPDQPYYYVANQFINTNTGWPIYEQAATGLFPQPRWGLNVTNRLLCFMVDSGSGRVIDYVQLNGMNDHRDLLNEIATDNVSGYYGLWSTNRLGGTDNVTDPPMGIVNQISVAMGNPQTPPAEWFAYNCEGGPLSNFEIASFRAFFSPSHEAVWNGTEASNTNLVQEAPFVPAGRRSRQWLWQANDPLVHYMSSDLLVLAFVTTNAITVEQINGPVTTLPIGHVNYRYSPWGRYSPATDTNTYNIAIKDPLITRSDDWAFPENQPLSFLMLGAVHRGTPWQTVFLKATNILSANNGLFTWQQWTGNADWNDAMLTAPVQDGVVVEALLGLADTNSPQLLMSVSTPDPNAWLEVLDGITVETNDAPGSQFIMSSNSPQADIIANAITTALSSSPNQRFSGVSSILSVPELSDGSPWLNPNATATDAEYEMIPAQLLMRLRPDSVGASTVMTNGTVQIEFTGLDDYSYSVEVSCDLVNWFSVATNSPVNGVFDFIDGFPPAAGSRFYRSVVQP